MLDDFLSELGEYMVFLIRQEIKTPRPRFTKRTPRMMKRNSPYNFYASGRGWESVSYEVIDDELYITMEDYMVDYVFGDGSWPGGGSYYPDTRGRGNGTTRSTLLQKLEKWIKDKGIVPRDKRGRFISRKSMAFAIRTNLFKAGFAGYNYRTPDFEADILREVDIILQQPKYADFVGSEEIQNIIDKINTFGQQTFNIALGRE